MITVRPAARRGVLCTMLVISGWTPIVRSEPALDTGSNPAVGPAQPKRMGDGIAILGQKLPAVNLSKATLSEAFEFMGDVNKVTIHIDWKLIERAGAKPDQPLNNLWPLRDIRLSELIQVVLWEAAGPGKLDFVVEEGVIRISTSGALNLVARELTAKEREESQAAATRCLKVPIKTLPIPIDDLQAEVIPAQHLRAVALKDALNFMREISKANVWVDWSALSKAGVKKDSKITAEVPANPTLAQWLESVLRAARGRDELAYTFVDGVVVISTKEVVNRIEAMKPMRRVR
jgi:hypothetical protein